MDSSATPVQLRGGAFTAMVLRLGDGPLDDVLRRLAQQVGRSPGFFVNAPLVLDLAELAEAGRAIDIVALAEALRALQLVPVGVQNADDRLSQLARTAGLAVMPVGRAAPEPSRTAPPPKLSAARPRTRLLSEPVRSGQQVYVEDGDLIVTAAVSAGAELIAEGNIHVYAPLRGRAMAGAAGDRNARIFCMSLEAELISIAGLYQASDDLDPAMYRRAVQITLDGDRLSLQPLVPLP